MWVRIPGEVSCSTEVCALSAFPFVFVLWIVSYLHPVGKNFTICLSVFTFVLTSTLLRRPMLADRRRHQTWGPFSVFHSLDLVLPSNIVLLCDQVPDWFEFAASKIKHGGVNPHPALGRCYARWLKQQRIKGGIIGDVMVCGCRSSVCDRRCLGGRRGATIIKIETEDSSTRWLLENLWVPPVCVCQPITWNWFIKPVTSAGKMSL